MIRLNSDNNDENILSIIESGADDVVEQQGELVVYCPMNQLASVRDSLKEKDFAIIEATLIYHPKNMIEITEAAVLAKIEKLIDALEEIDDVTDTYANFDVADNLS